MHQPLAYVHPQAKIAQNVVIEPFVTIDKDVEIEEGTWIGPHVTIMGGARIGKNCKIYPGAVIAAVPQDLKFSDENSIVEIGDNTIIREYVTVNRGTRYSHKTVVGSNCLLMAYVHVAHDCIIGDHCILANNATLAGHIEIGDYAILGGMTAIHQFVKVGSHAFLAGGSLVNKDVPPYVKAARFPLSYVGTNSIGLRRRDFTNEQINRIQDIYRVLFVKPYNTSQALDFIECELPASAEKDEILQFVGKSTRGLMRGFKSRHDNNR
jgi:UDP-N-acetylglucosamine acyltransferase